MDDNVKVVWTKDGEPLAENKTVIVANADKHTMLTVSNTTKEGSYGKCKKKKPFL
jgi:hypothetical protein